jgi:hypothetical protein
MRRLTLTSAVTLLAFLLLVPPAWAEWSWPVRGEVITPYRNGTDPYASGQHRGIDIAASTGTTVVAATSGEVRFAGTAGSSGLTVSVRTADGRYDTTYLHLSSTAVREGDRVAAGQPLGAVGTSGTRSATEPHLHFGVRDAGSRHAYHDPLGFLPPPTATQPPRGAPAPEPAPVPIGPAPAPVNAPATRRIPVPAPAPRRVPVGAPRRVPVGAPGRVPVGAPRRVPVGAPGRVAAGAPRRVPVGAPRRVPVGAPRSVPAGQARPIPAGAPDHSPANAPHRAPLRAPTPLETRAGAPRHSGAPAAPNHGRPLLSTHSAAATGPNAALAHSAGGGAPGEHSPPAASSHAASPHAGTEPGSTRAPHPTGPDIGLLAACLGLLAAAAVLGLTGEGRKATRETRHRIARALQPMLGRR